MKRTLALASCLALPLMAAPAFAQSSNASGTMPSNDATSQSTMGQTGAGMTGENQTGMGADQGSMAGGKLTSADRRFVDKAAMSGIAEVQAAQLAQQKASSDQVKQFAQKMITDHSQLNQNLTQTAQTLGVTPPTSLDSKYQSQMSKLQNLSGEQFDKAYMKDQVRDHEQAIKLFRTEANDGQNPQLKQLAEQSLPILQQHLQMARSDMKTASR